VITANLATYDGRQKFLRKTIESLKNQTVKFDAIRVWYNCYKPDKESGIEQHYNGMDYTDRGKFIWLDNLRIEGKHEIYFSCDDDLIYPPDYVERMIDGMKRHPGHVVSFHGRRLLGEHRNYYFEHKAFNFLVTIEGDNQVHVPGTGVTAFDTRVITPDIIQYKDNCMADVLMGLEMAKAGVPGMCLAHERGWIKSQPTRESIYKNHARRCTVQSRYADDIWRYCKNNEKHVS
jgi:hypothetical protein